MVIVCDVVIARRGHCVTWSSCDVVIARRGCFFLFVQTAGRRRGGAERCSPHPHARVCVQLVPELADGASGHPLD